MSRLRLELRDGGFQVIELEEERPRTESVGTTAERERVNAAVRVDANRGTVTLWVRRPDSSIEETFTTRGEGPRSQILAIRVAEALRARGLLLPPPPADSAGESDEAAPPNASDAGPELPKAKVAAPRETVSTPARETAPSERSDEVSAPASTPVLPRSGFSIDLAPGIALSPGGLGPFVVGELALRAELVPDVSVACLGIAPLSRQSLARDEGEAEASTYVVGGLLELEWAHFSFGSLRSGAGGGASITRMTGSAASGFQSETDTVTAFTPLVVTSFQVELSRLFELRTAVLGGATLPEVQMAFGQREVASWGRPFAIATLGLEARP
jgi:hypothetical protein